MRRSLIIVLMLLTLSFISGVNSAIMQSSAVEYTGTLNAQTPSESYPIMLESGQAVLVTAQATSGDLDTVLTLFDPNDRVVVENDDIDFSNTDSQLVFTASATGTYTIRISRYDRSENSGSYLLAVKIGTPADFQAEFAEERVGLSGPELTRDTDHFRIHYTQSGEDSATDAYINAMALSLEEIWRIQIDQMGWPPPPVDNMRGGDNRYDIYVADLLGADEGAMGYASPEYPMGDNPNTTATEEYATSSYVTIENDFHAFTEDPSETPISLMRTTAAHEFHHAIQFGYDIRDTMFWYYEATASYMEIASLVKDEAASYYVQYVYEYPELCFGVVNEPTGQLMYGSWLYLQNLVDLYGVDIIKRLWENIAQLEGFEALKQTLGEYGTDIPESLFDYHVKNLVRDYELASEFGATVWLDSVIDAAGRWESSTGGAQELGANYIQLLLPPDTYYVGLVNDAGALELTAVGIRGDQADEIPLERGGNITTKDYDYVYLVVFNPHYDENIDDCIYYDYSVDVSRAKGGTVAVKQVRNAGRFEPLK